ncbi:hypothetical protein [Fibrella forsythiae]|uniref:Uncharacterized protein n=1 Tax=Fibrella forsythiae TaxID=2817061 RepID=A0ABS3JP27_9BACT|nr:hypothetical protein [Fibrella forsythiae]MBO0950672.1 hypothetical protein [Fibrella forsythiae]
MHKPYQQLRGHSEDFKVRYRFYSQEEGGRYSLPHQGIRTDFWYECADHEMTGVFMICPEFEDEYGDLLLEGEVLPEGIARMWISNPRMRAYHRSRIQLGTIGYFKEATRSTGVCEVIELVGLMQNPIK